MKPIKNCMNVYSCRKFVGVPDGAYVVVKNANQFEYEKDYSLKISKYMYDRFRELGIPVTLTRDTDITLSPSDRVDRILDAYGDNPNVIVVSNHLNAGGGDSRCVTNV